MKYFTIHTKDSGAFKGSIEEINKLFNHNRKTNSLADVLIYQHDPDELVMNDKTFRLFTQCNLMPYDPMSVVIKSIKTNLGLFNIYKSHKYHYINIKNSNDLFSYRWINFEKSEILIFKRSIIDEKKDSVKKEKLKSHEQLVDAIKVDKKERLNFSEVLKSKQSEEEIFSEIEKYKRLFWECNKIVFNRNFDTSIDLFKVPLYSSATYISEKLKDLLIENKITNIGFAETKKDLDKSIQSAYPTIEFE